MRSDWFSASALYIPAWILAGTGMGIWGPRTVPAIVIWLVIGGLIAIFAWRASAQQVMQSRLIAENLGKLVSVTEPSPVNILTAAAAKILTLESEINSVKEGQWRSISARQKKAFHDSLSGEITQVWELIG